uniref:Uncharacterized protein n=1 Tax=Cacopsylla melanoneura TaxID=428564 RepID=A0A8D8ZAR8_9HEMI
MFSLFSKVDQESGTCSACLDSSVMVESLIVSRRRRLFLSTIVGPFLSFCMLGAFFRLALLVHQRILLYLLLFARNGLPSHFSHSNSCILNMSFSGLPLSSFSLCRCWLVFFFPKTLILMSWSSIFADLVSPLNTIIFLYDIDLCTNI